MMRPKPNMSAKDHDDMLRSGLDVASRTIFVIGEITEQTFAQVITSLHVLQKTDEPIRVLINSGGGSVEQGLAVLDALTVCPNQIVTLGFGNVCSIAATIFQAGDWRILSPECRYMVHAGSVDMEGSLHYLEAKALSDELVFFQDRITDLFQKRTNLPIAEVRAMFGGETYFSAEECVKKNIADQVLERPTKPPLNPKKPRKAIKKKRT